MCGIDRCLGRSKPLPYRIFYTSNCGCAWIDRSIKPSLAREGFGEIYAALSSIAHPCLNFQLSIFNFQLIHSPR